MPAPAPQVPGASSLPLEMLGLPAAAPAKAEPPAGWICVDFEATEASGVPIMSAIGTSNLPPALCILCGSAGKEEVRHSTFQSMVFIDFCYFSAAVLCHVLRAIPRLLFEHEPSDEQDVGVRALRVVRQLQQPNNE